MYKVKIYGAGSIGNHLAYACRRNNWEVLICDVDRSALDRTKKDIYPSRYGKWDDSIRLSTVNELDKKEDFDLVIIGSPPDTHMVIATQILNENPPKALLIEKPLCTPSLNGCEELLALANKTKTFVGVAYNHVTTENTLIADNYLRNLSIGKPLTINVQWLEYWGGIFNAHPWLDGPHDTYLGFSVRGGGACSEHSHSINIWQHFAGLTGMGKVIEVNATMDFVKTDKVDYDRLSIISLKTEEGLVGNVITDVITEPARKSLRIQGETGFFEWAVNYSKGNDYVKYQGTDGNLTEKLIPKTRPDDFQNEINHIGNILSCKINGKDSPIYIEKGLDTMMVIAAAHKSATENKIVTIDYKKGYSLRSLN